MRLSHPVWPLFLLEVARSIWNGASFLASSPLLFPTCLIPTGYLKPTSSRAVLGSSSPHSIDAQHRPDDTKAIHASDVFLKPLEQLAIFDGDPVARLELPGLAKQENWLALHPGSGSEHKNWPEQNWRKLVAYLLDHSPLNLLLVGGEAEGAQLQRLAKDLLAERVQLAQHVPLSELAPRLAKCSGYIGHDSGVTHLASALGLPTLVLWAKSDEKIWRPLGERVRVLNQHSDLAELTLETVVEGINALELEAF